MSKPLNIILGLGLTETKVLDKYKVIFTVLGRLKIEHVKICLRKDAVPKRKPCRRVPIAIRQKCKAELDHLCNIEVLDKK